MTQTSVPTLVEVKNVKKSFKKQGSQELLVLDQVDLNVREGEIVALLGKSGSGKSTLLRIISGLIQPDAGQVRFRGREINAPIPELTMVFQHFALLPWCTVLENVELGLQARGVPREERRKRALEAIDVVGLDGFESAYPKELSGGMSQRVGFARALVVDPEILLMDEPFSALDVLTAENLRGDLIDILQSEKTRIKGTIIVTHNIEEAAYLADRILMFGTNPGYVKSEIKVDLPHPRNDQDADFRKVVDEIYTQMTSSRGDKTKAPGVKYKTIGMGHRLPVLEISELVGFVESLVAPEYEERSRFDLPELAEELHLDVDDLFPITEALEILRFAHVSEGDIELSETGKRFANADILQKKKLFAMHLLNYVPFARHIRRVLDERPQHRATEARFLSELEDYLSEQAAEETLKVVIDWGRYAEIFAYDFNTGLLSLENPE